MTSDLRHGAATDVGRRDTNQDFYLANPPLFAVADGMGGHRAGDVAARTAVEVLEAEVRKDHGALMEAVKAANRVIHEKAVSDPDLRDMGTTVTAMVVGDSSARIVHVGDSRAYLLRGGALSQVTQDHSVVARLVREGQIRPEDADHHPQRSVVERAVGVGPDVDVDVHTVGVEAGDRVLLCSDGLTGVLDDEEIERILEDENDPDRASKKLVEEAVSSGASDNVTAIVIDLPGGPGGGRARIVSRKRLAVFAAAVVALMLLALAAQAVIGTQYYVGENRGRVTIFRGVPANIAGFRLSRVVDRTDLETSSLPEAVRSDLEKGIDAQGVRDARQIIANLRDLRSGRGSPETSPSPGSTAPSPSPTPRSTGGTG